jgi:hypothetical protein
MAVPTTRFRTFPRATTVAELDTPAKRKAAISGESAISTGGGNELDFGTVDISGGTANSLVFYGIWDVTADGGNTAVDTFKFWLSDNGFVQAATHPQFQPISGDDGTPSSTEAYIVDAVVGDYTWIEMPEAEPSVNMYPTDEGAGMVLSTTSDDAIMWAEYVLVAASETTGTYAGVTASFEFQHSFKYSYS